MEGVVYCDSMTVTAAGDVVVWARTGSNAWEAQWYDQQGKLIHTLLRPAECEHWDLRILAVEVGVPVYLARVP